MILRPTKNIIFFKRTVTSFLPLALGVASARIASGSPDTVVFSPILSLYGTEIAPDSAKALSHLLQKPLPSSIEDYGDLLVFKPSLASSNPSSNLFIEKFNPFFTFPGIEDYSFKKAKVDGLGGENSAFTDEHLKLVKDSSASNEKYVFSQSDFSASSIKDKGNIKLIAELVATINDDSTKLPFTTLIPISDLVLQSQNVYPILSVNDKDGVPSEKYDIKLTKDSTAKTLGIELTKSSVDGNSRRKRSTDYVISDSRVTSVVFSNFYFLFSEEPSVDFHYAFEVESVETNTRNFNLPINSIPMRKIHLSNWKNKNNGNGSGDEPKFKFSTENGFWRSTCKDPYKVGGFIDEDLEDKASKRQDVGGEEPTHTFNSSTNIKKQQEMWKEFRPRKPKDLQKKQYWWQEKSSIGDFVPSSDYTTPTPCEGMDEDTKKLLVEYKDKSFENNEVQRNINQDLMPQAIKKASGIDSTANGNNNSYPFTKVIQSAFRAWGNDYVELSDVNVKNLGTYNRSFELERESNHEFTITVEKSEWEKHLVEHSKLNTKDTVDGTKKLNEESGISTALKIHVPLSFYLYDPVSNFLRRRSVILETGLDLRTLFSNSSFSENTLTFNLDDDYGRIGDDYQGYAVNTEGKKKEYGLDGKVTFQTILSLNRNKDLEVTLNSKISGFVNTKNPTCDLRHRVFKFGLDSDSNLKNDKKCSSQPGWSWRKHNYIPSFIVLSLDKEPQISSFILDNRKTALGIEKDDEKSVNSLKKFKDSISTRTIKRFLPVSEGNNGEVFFDNITAYDSSSHEKKNPIHVNSGRTIHYYHPRKQTNELIIKDHENVKKLYIQVEGASNNTGSFWRSGHYGTVETVCFTNKYDDQTSLKSECGDGRKYEKIEKDQKPNKVSDYYSQSLEVPWEKIKEKKTADDPLSFYFRMLMNRKAPDSENGSDVNRFDNRKSNYQSFLSDNATDSTMDVTNQLDFSITAVWYSMDMWWDETSKKLTYVTKLRPISMTAQQIDNSKATYMVGASGSAGFQIRRFELEYS